MRRATVSRSRSANLSEPLASSKGEVFYFPWSHLLGRLCRAAHIASPDTSNLTAHPLLAPFILHAGSRAIGVFRGTTRSATASLAFHVFNLVLTRSLRHDTRADSWPLAR